MDLLRESLAGKVAVILGVGPGQGITTAKLFINSGAKVALISRSGESYGLVESSTIKIYKADATKEESLVSARDKILQDYGQIDALHINVGKWIEPEKKEEFVLKEKMMDMFESNVLALSSAMDVFSEAMKKKGGAIVNVGASEGLFKNNSISYTVAKSAIKELTRKAAEVLRKYNIRVNAVLPGAVSRGSNYRQVFPFNVKNLSDTTNLDPIEVGFVTVFLCSDMASGITGQSITVDRGMNTVK